MSMTGNSPQTSGSAFWYCASGESRMLATTCAPALFGELYGMATKLLLPMVPSSKTN